MKIKNSCWFILLIIILSCDGVTHDKTTIILKGFENQKKIIYETPETKIYIGYKGLFEFGYNGNLKIFDKNSNSFVKKIIIDIVETESKPPYSNILYTGIYITLTDGRIIFSEPLGIKS